MLDERLAGAQFSKFACALPLAPWRPALLILTDSRKNRLDPSFLPHVQNPFPDLSFVMLLFTFECKGGAGSGYVSSTRAVRTRRAAA